MVTAPSRTEYSAIVIFPVKTKNEKYKYISVDCKMEMKEDM